MPPDFTLHQYRVFLKTAELGSITRAANAMAVPQPSVSRSISRMESALQVKLIERHRGGITLTAAGKRFQPHVFEAIRQFELANLAASEETSSLSGEVRLAAPESVPGVLFQPLVKGFGEQFPRARIRVMTSASVLIPTLMDNRIIDLGIIADTHPAPATRAQLLCRESLYLVGPRDDPAFSGKTVTLKQAAKLPLILNAMQGGFRARIDEAFRQRDLRPRVIAEIDANEPLLDLVLDAAGFSILPFSAIARRDRARQFTAARIVRPEITRALKLVPTPHQPLPPIGRACARLLRQIVAAEARNAKWRLPRDD